MKYEFIKAHASGHPVEKMCNFLEVSRSGYYDWIDRPLSNRDEKRKKILDIIKKTHIKYPVLGLDPSKHNSPVAPNLLEQDFNADLPNTVWVGDITYNWTEEGWLYTAIVKDLCTKDVVGYAIGNRMTKELVINAMKMALIRENPNSGLIFHSDRGSQYCSNDFKTLLKTNQIRQSMSRKGNPYDNAPAENFFSCLKCECTSFYYFKNRDEAKQVIFEYIEVYYNRQRRHAALGWITPVAYKKLFTEDLVA